jgi:oxaloacetate decarboxylase gamma subunit
MAQGLELMVAGMGVVFAFLTLMVFTMHGAAAIIRKIEKPETPQNPGAGSASSHTDELAMVAVAIAAASAQTRN